MPAASVAKMVIDPCMNSERMSLMPMVHSRSSLQEPSWISMELIFDALAFTVNVSPISSVINASLLSARLNLTWMVSPETGV